MDRERDARVAHPSDPRGDRTRVEAHLRRHVRGVRLLLLQRGEQDPVRDRGMTFRIARHADGPERMSQLLHRAEQREPVMDLAPVLGVPADDERVPIPADAQRPSNSPRWARSRIMCAARCGVAGCPRAINPSQSSIVDSIPCVGDAVTVAAAPGGKACARSSASRSGMSSNSGCSRRARRTTSASCRRAFGAARPSATPGQRIGAASPSGSPSSGPNAASARPSRRPCPSASRPRASSPAPCARSAASRARCSSPCRGE